MKKTYLLFLGMVCVSLSANAQNDNSPKVPPSSPPPPTQSFLDNIQKPCADLARAKAQISQKSYLDLFKDCVISKTQGTLQK